MSSQPLIDRVLLEKLERLTLQWQKSFSGLIGGHNLSHFAGSGQEFLDHRHFHQGDDLRAVNWRAYLRLEKLFLKMFQIEPRVPVRLLLDTSASMATGETAAKGTPSKFDYARKLAAALAYVGLVRLDAITLQPFSATLGDSFLCGGGRHRFQPAAQFLASLESAGRTNYFEVARQCVDRYPQRGLLIVISDFLDDGDCQRSLQHLADFGHELLLIQLWSAEDRNPEWEGEMDLIDAETGAHLKISLDEQARLSYREAFDQYAGGIQKLAARNGGRYAGLETSLPIEEAIFGPLAHARSVELHY